MKIILEPTELRMETDRQTDRQTVKAKSVKVGDGKGPEKEISDKEWYERV